MKITRLQAENFKRLRAVEIVPGEGPIVEVTGKNAQGKSSVLDAIQAALGGKAVMPAKPVRTGTDGGAIRLELDAGALVIRRTFDTDGGGQIIVESAEGARFPSPQHLLDSLYTSVAFDPLEFVRHSPAEQYRILRQLVKLDVDPDKLEAENRLDYEARRDVNRELRTAEAQYAQMPVYEDAPASPIDEDAISSALAEAADLNVQFERRKANREAFAAETERLRAQVAELEVRLRGIETQKSTLEKTIAERVTQIESAEPLPEPIDIGAAQQELLEARETNRRVRAMVLYTAQGEIIAGLKDKATRLTESMEARAAQVAAAIEAAEMPVAGLSFADGAVLFQGEPFAQASSAEQLRVSAAIGMAGNPKLRVMLVRNGSLLDEDGEKLLAEMAGEHDFQLWVETVDSSGTVGIVMEDGAVKDAPPPAPLMTAKRAKKQDAAETSVPDGTATEASGRQGAGEDPSVAPVPAPGKQERAKAVASLFGE